MKAEDYQRFSDIFDRFSSEKNVVGTFQNASGSIESYQGTTRMMDKTGFILAAIEMAKTSGQTVKGNEHV